jgi:hypothetical protein
MIKPFFVVVFANSQEGSCRRQGANQSANGSTDKPPPGSPNVEIDLEYSFFPNKNQYYQNLIDILRPPLLAFDYRPAQPAKDPMGIIGPKPVTYGSWDPFSAQTRQCPHRRVTEDAAKTAAPRPTLQTQAGYTPTGA